MRAEIGYMLGVVAVVFAVNYALRILPFLLFSGKNRALPGWVEPLGKVISPIIIAGLIVYAYAGSAWRTPWPYLAGAVTVLLQLWRRNALLSIVTGTVLYMVLVSCCGCATQQVELDARHPAVRVSTQGFLFGEQFMPAEEIAATLAGCGVPRDRVIHIRLDPDVRDLRPARLLMAHLRKAGYTRPILVTKRHSASENLGKPAKAAAPRAGAPSAAKTIRYRKADE
ncbi:MAG: branched-chain amino acid transporter permease [Kiritimatiellia bacterium]